jgi:hypothetical protein
VIVAVVALAGGGVAAGILLTEGGSSPGASLKPRYAYPANVKTQLLDACELHSHKSACECVVRAYEATMPAAIYRQITLGGVRLNNRAYYEAFTSAAARCSQ